MFWTLQTVGWIGYAVMNFLQGLAHDKTEQYIYPSIAYAMGGFFVTLGLRQAFHLIWNRHAWTIAAGAMLSILIAALLFAAYRTWAFIHLYPTDWEITTWWYYFSDLALPILLMVAWSGLYFGIKYYRMLQRQNEMVLKATNAAHQAQLKMLRYQLNPHFLFNTLNAISTLVLEQNTNTANQMVTRLSSFLRHSLDRDPMQKVTLKKELDALNLYLSIEKIRFDDRLKLEFDIEDKAYNALVPSLILQPLIENCIKYAVAESETGGTIAICAEVEDSQLCMVVADDGPGAADLLDNAMSKGSGVGLQNTRERLSVLYGRNHQFNIKNREPKGLAVRICIPYEVTH